MPRKQNKNDRGSRSLDTVPNYRKASPRNVNNGGSLTMADEARYTERRKGNFLKSTLRNNEVNFISAGVNPGHDPHLEEKPMGDNMSKLHPEGQSPSRSMAPSLVKSEESEVGDEVILFAGKNNVHAVSTANAVTLQERTDLVGGEIPCGGTTGPKDEAGIGTLDLTLQSRQPESRQNAVSAAEKLDVCGSYCDSNDSAFADYIENMAARVSPSPHPSTECQHSMSADTVSRVQPQVCDLAVRYVPHPKKANTSTGDSVSDSERSDDVTGIGNVGNRSGASDNSEDLAARDFIAALASDGDEQRNVVSEQGRLADSDIARRLAKQEELGLGSAEILLFDGNDGVPEADGEDDEDLDIVFLREQARRYADSGRQKRGSKKAHTTMPDVDVLIDDYGDFDMMGTNEPSLQPRKKKKHGIMDFGVSDSELEGKMILAWEQDRSRKKAHKQHRESLRAQGLLGKNGNVDMIAKYPGGMKMDQIREELRVFLVSDRETLDLIPLDKEDRRIIHEMANRFRVKSVSRGSGDQRYPCLIKTSRTRPFNEEVFSALEDRFSRRFLPRKEKIKSIRGTAKRGTRMAAASVAYKDGEVVGATAPELNSTNRGRAMLEKMGWNSGDALGAFNNKGMLLPISHTVKNTRTGLG